MSNNPWEFISSTPALFIVDAEHNVEEELLINWLKTTQTTANYSGHFTHCVVSIAHNPENIPTEGLTTALDMPEETLVAPIRVVWRTELDNLKRKPRFKDLWRGNLRRPNQKKAQALLKQDATLAQCIMGKPATIADLRSRYEHRKAMGTIDDKLVDYVAEQASLALEVAERRLRGSRYKVPRQVSKQVRGSSRYKKGLQKIALEGSETEAQLRARALPYFKELVALPHNFWQDVAASFSRWIISLGYDNELVVNLDQLEMYRATVREHPSAFLWTHKTHMDGITMQSVLFENDFPPPHIMGGINMAFAGIGFLARRYGAIFIRRSFQDNPLYKLVLREYLAYLLEKRFPLTWSFEGTRSRVGKLMPPKYGMLKYVMDAMQHSSADDFHIIPVAINYDMNNDVKDYAAEQSGAIKRPESLSWFISYLRRMRKPLGRIYVDFGEPVVVKKNAFDDDPLALQKTAFKVGVEANRVTPITLTSLMCLSLLAAAPRAQTFEELNKHMQALKEWAKHRDVKFTSDFDDCQEAAMLRQINNMVASELINCYDEGPETVYAVAADQDLMASYYRNSIVHHFIPKAIAELALMAAASDDIDPRSAFWNEVNDLRDLFKYEFFYVPTNEFHLEIKKELAYFDSDWEAQLTNRVQILSLLRSMTPLVAHACLTPYVEAYRIMAGVFARLDANDTLDEKASVTAAFTYGRQAYLQRRITSKASIGQTLFKNAYKVMKGYDIVDIEQPFADDSLSNATLSSKRKDVSQRFRTLSLRLEKIKALALPIDIT